jgi:hypothetical protein
MDSKGVRTAVILNVLVWGLGYIYLRKLIKGTYTFFAFSLFWGFYLIVMFIFGFDLTYLIETLIGYFVSSLWFGYDAYSLAINVKEEN